MIFTEGVSIAFLPPCGSVSTTGALLHLVAAGAPCSRVPTPADGVAPPAACFGVAPCQSITLCSRPAPTVMREGDNGDSALDMEVAGEGALVVVRGGEELYVDVFLPLLPQHVATSTTMMMTMVCLPWGHRLKLPPSLWSLIDQGGSSVARERSCKLRRIFDVL